MAIQVGILQPMGNGGMDQIFGKTRQQLACVEEGKARNFEFCNSGI